LVKWEKKGSEWERGKNHQERAKKKGRNGPRFSLGQDRTKKGEKNQKSKTEGAPWGPLLSTPATP